MKWNTGIEHWNGILEWITKLAASCIVELMRDCQQGIKRGQRGNYGILYCMVGISLNEPHTNESFGAMGHVQ